MRLKKLQDLTKSEDESTTFSLRVPHGITPLTRLFAVDRFEVYYTSIIWLRQGIE